MANDIKLDVYTVRLKKRNKSEIVNFDQILRAEEGDGEGQIVNFSTFFTAYIQSFNSKFFVHNKTSKAISLKSEDVKFGKKSQTITGRIDGGTTGIGSAVKNRDDNRDENSFQVSTEKVIAIPYYFKLWTPLNSNVGILIMQGFGSRSMADAFKAHLQNFTSDYTRRNLSMVFGSLIPNSVQKEIVNKGLVNSLTLKTYHLPSTKGEKLLGLQYMEGNNLTVEVKISGLAKVAGWQQKVNGFFSGKIKKLVDVSTLADLGISETSETHVKFEHNGKSATAKSSDNFEVFPSYYIDKEDVMLDDKKHPTFESLDIYCKSFLKTLKEQIGYANP